MSDQAQIAPRRRIVAAMAAEANGLIDSLDDPQRGIALWPFPSDEERRRWYYTPTDHGGLTLAAMSTPQHRLVHRLVASGLSTPGYVTAAVIIGLENVLDQLEGFNASFDRPRGRDPLMYFLRIFGTPSPSGTWSWRLGGHHVSLNFTIIDGELAGVSPLFFGADPASAPLLGPHPLRPLAGVEDGARELARSLTAEQQARAILSPRAPTDLVGANRPSLADGDRTLPLSAVWRYQFEGGDAERLIRAQQALDVQTGVQADDLDAIAFSRRPKGLAASAMDLGQREALDALLRLYVNRLPDDLADEEAGKFEGAALDGVHLLWAGSLEPGEPHYYRLHSERILVEYENAARNANHVHTVWRDPLGDFADDPLARHHAKHHHD